MRVKFSCDTGMSVIHRCTEKETDLRRRKGNKRQLRCKTGREPEGGRRRGKRVSGRNDGDSPAISPENEARREWQKGEKEKEKNQLFLRSCYLQKEKNGRKAVLESVQPKDRTVLPRFSIFFNLFLFLFLFLFLAVRYRVRGFTGSKRQQDEGGSNTVHVGETTPFLRMRSLPHFPLFFPPIL